ncbi:MAG TPA: adenylate kinase family protein [archaeon]|nr:adenylate kinase family protein [archaeon]
MLIVITGTPGTGKTAVAAVLKEKLSAHVIDIDYLVKKYKIKSHLDKKRKSKIIDEHELAVAAEKENRKGEIVVFEGLMSHFARADLTVILRTEPHVLHKRLQEREWHKPKIKENIEAEVIDSIATECVDKKNVVELDTTENKPEDIADIIASILNNYSLQKRYLPGRIDWSEHYVKYLRG